MLPESGLFFCWVHCPCKFQFQPLPQNSRRVTLSDCENIVFGIWRCKTTKKKQEVIIFVRIKNELSIVFLFFSPSVKPECLLSHCIMAPMLALDPALPANLTLKELPTVSSSFSAAKELLLLNKPFHPSTSASVVVFHSQADGKHTHKKKIRNT